MSGDGRPEIAVAGGLLHGLFLFRQLPPSPRPAPPPPPPPGPPPPEPPPPPPGPPPPLQFEPAQRYPFELAPSSLAIGDVTGDRRNDLLVGTSGDNQTDGRLYVYLPGARRLAQSSFLARRRLSRSCHCDRSGRHRRRRGRRRSRGRVPRHQSLRPEGRQALGRAVAGTGDLGRVSDPHRRLRRRREEGPAVQPAVLLTGRVVRRAKPRRLVRRGPRAQGQHLRRLRGRDGRPPPRCRDDVQFHGNPQGLPASRAWLRPAGHVFAVPPFPVRGRRRRCNWRRPKRRRPRRRRRLAELVPDGHGAERSGNAQSTRAPSRPRSSLAPCSSGT